MKPPVFEYFAPRTLLEAVSLLSSHDNARLLAGGQSLMAMLNMRFVFPDRVIDLNRVPELDFIDERDNAVVVGAMTRQRTLQRSEVIAAKLPVIPKALRYVGHFQTRNRGTIGGSLCQLDPAAELPAIAMAYDATLLITGPAGDRTIPFDQFPLMYMTSSLAPEEILTSISFTPWQGIVGTGFAEFSRRHGDFAIAGAIALLEGEGRDTVRRASITLFGVSEAPKRADQAEKLLKGQRLTPQLIEDAAQLCSACSTLDDTYGSARYRGHVAATMAKKALTEAFGEMDRK